MASTYTQIYIHTVMVVKGRMNHISPEWKNQLCKYITGIVLHKKCKVMVINGMHDHLHILLSIGPDRALSDLMRDIKANSSRWINEKRYISGKFEWQTGFGAFSVSKSQVEKVARYIEKQEVHHRKKTFREEYVGFLQAYSVDYKAEFIFEDFGIAPSELMERKRS